MSSPTSKIISRALGQHARRRQSTLSGSPMSSWWTRSYSPSPSPANPAPSPTSAPPPTSSNFNSINPAEIAHFSSLSSQWWDERGEFGLLHKMNPVRMEYVRQKVVRGKEDDAGWTFENRGKDLDDGGAKWLDGMEVLDVGCGGGLLSESLARVGATTLAIDASPSNILIARLHASQDPFLPLSPSSSLSSSSSPHTHALNRVGSLEYRNCPAEELEKEGRTFDVVCSMEVVEHVEEPGEFLKCLGRMVKPGGHLILSTISRTPLSHLLTITLAEHLLRLVTPGTHTYSKFIKPSELLQFVVDEMGGADVWEEGEGRVLDAESGGGVGVGEVRGIVYDPLGGRWRLWPEGVPGGEAVNYMFALRKKRE